MGLHPFRGSCFATASTKSVGNSKRARSQRSVVSNANEAGPVLSLRCRSGFSERVKAWTCWRRTSGWKSGLDSKAIGQRRSQKKQFPIGVIAALRDPNHIEIFKPHRKVFQPLPVLSRKHLPCGILDPPGFTKVVFRRTKWIKWLLKEMLFRGS